MKMNMTKWIEDMIDSPVKKALPILSFPVIQKMNITVQELISDSGLQAEAMKVIADSTDACASVSFMDLSVEAECFGATIRMSDEEVPTVIGSIVDTQEAAEALKVPDVHSGRASLYIEAIRKATPVITDRPILAGAIGPFSLAGRLMDVSEAMIYCYEEPDMVHIVLEKVTEFIIAYILEFKAAGANGIVLAEPLAGLLSPDLAEEFSANYVKKIVDAVQDDEFIMVYHNCGNSTIPQVESIVGTKAKLLHFGNAIDMREMLPLIPKTIVVAGNIDPAGQFKNGTVESIKAETRKLLEACSKYPNFLISSGCDIPPLAKWENIEAFFATVAEFYAAK